MRMFLERLAWKMERFMRDRNGMDDLNRAIYYLSLGLFIVGIFVSSAVVSLLLFVTIGASLFRMLSKNLPKRQRENAWYLDKTSAIRAKFGGRRGGSGYQGGRSGSMMEEARKKAEQQRLRFEERKEYKFFKCKCGATVRVRRGNGTREFSCPICHEKMTRNTN